MSKANEAIATGTIVAQHRDVRGEMISVAITLPKPVWEDLTAGFDDSGEVWEDLEMRELTLEDRVALYVSGEVDGWCQTGHRSLFDDDLDDDVPF